MRRCACGMSPRVSTARATAASTLTLLIAWTALLPTGTCHRTIAAHSEAVTDVDFNRDGTLIASCSYDGLIRLWDVPTGLCLATLPQPASSPTTSIKFSPSSTHLLASSLDSTLRLWDVGLGRVVKTYRPEREAGRRGEEAEGTTTIGGGRMYQNEKFAIKASFVLGPSPAHETSSSRQQRRTYIVAGSEDCRLYFWDVQTRRLAAVLGGHHRDVVSAVAVHPTQPILASAALDHDLAIKVYFDAGPQRSREDGAAGAPNEAEMAAEGHQAQADEMKIEQEAADPVATAPVAQ